MKQEKSQKELYSTSCILLSELDEQGLRLVAEVIQHEYERCLLTYDMPDKRPRLSHQN